MNSKILLVCLFATILLFGIEEVAAGKDTSQKSTGEKDGKNSGSNIADKAKNAAKKAADAVTTFAENFAGP